MMKVVYIAGKFRGPNSWEMEQNIRRAEELSLQVWQRGAAALCPHTNTRFFQGAGPDSLWLEGTLALLAKCDACIMVPGWELSIGARGELAYALEHDIPVFYRLDELEEWLEEPTGAWGGTPAEALRGALEETTKVLEWLNSQGGKGLKEHAEMERTIGIARTALRITGGP